MIISLKLMKTTLPFLLLTTTSISVGCNKSKDAAAVTPVLADPAVAGVESPTAAGTLNLMPSIVLASPTGTASATALNLGEGDGAELDKQDPKEAAAALDTVFEAATTVNGCLVGLGRAEPPQPNASCYGPSVRYENHPDGTDPNGTFLPSGDLGVFDAEEAGGQACVAAKMNQMTGTIRGRVSQAIETGKRVLCFANVLEKALPTVAGEEIDLAADVATALEAIKTDVAKKGTLSFSTIKIKLLSLENDLPIYQTEVAAELPNGALWTRAVTKKSSETKSEGYVWGVFDRPAVTGGNGQQPQGAETNVFSVIFNKDGDALRYDATRSVAQSEADKALLAADKTSLFESDKRVRVASTGNPGYSHVLASLDNATGAGEMIFMWTAGGDQEEQRTLHAKVTVSGETKAGWGYFGFGAKLADLRALVKAGTVPATQMSIEKMICNWAGPNHSHAGIAFAQKQEMNFSDGRFVPTTNHVGFAAQNSCGQSGAGTNFGVAKGDQNATGLTFVPWAAFSLVDISSGEDKTNLQSLSSLLVPSSL